MPDAIKRSDERSFAPAVREEMEGKRKIFHVTRYTVSAFNQETSLKEPSDEFENSILQVIFNQLIFTR